MVLSTSRNFCLHSVQTASGSHLTSYPMEASAALSSGVKLPTHLYLVVPRSRMLELYLNSPYTFIECCLIKSSYNFIS